MCSEPPITRQVNMRSFNTSSRRPPRRSARGFSLVEVMVVVVIIGMLAGAVAIKVTDYMQVARVKRAKQDIATIVDAVEAYYAIHSRYPSNEDGLTNLPLKNLTDPWGHPYQYNAPGPDDEPFEVVSFGEDQREGGDDAAADLYSWNINALDEKD